MRNIKTYSELITLPTFIERYEYLKIGGNIGIATFGYDRYLNQILYTSDAWRTFRRDIILRDNACDLGVDGYDMEYRITVHHIIPITIEDVINRSPKVFDPENVISTSHNTHMAIHYGDKDKLILAPTERRPNDTCPWRQ